MTYDTTLNKANCCLQDYVNALCAVCDKYSVPIIDLFSVSDLDPTDPTIKTKYFHADDAVHPNANGHEIIARVIKNYLELFANNVNDSNGNDTTDSAEVSLQYGNKFSTDSSSTAHTRVSSAVNLYLKAGQTVILKDNATYKWAMALSGGEISTAKKSDWYPISSGWTTASGYTVQTDGWYGIVICKQDGSEFNFDRGDSQDLYDYVDFRVELTFGNRFANSNDHNRASSCVNLYLQAGQKITINNKDYRCAVAKTTGDSDNGSNSYVAGTSWAEFEVYTVQASGWYGFTFKRTDNAEFVFGSSDSANLFDYISIE